MRLTTVKRSLVVFLIALLGVAQSADGQETVLEALREGSTSASLLLRGEGVQAETFDESAGALTLRTQFGYQTGIFRNWSLYGEFEAVSAVMGDETYANAGAGDRNNSVSDRPVIADPQGAEVNQGWLRYEADKIRMTLGRQEIILSDARFIGNVGWRQNHQSYDAARLDVTPSDRISGTYAFIREAHRITGQDVTMRSHLAEGRLLLGDMGRLTAFAFLLDYTNQPALSRSTVGARFDGSRALSDKLAGTVEVSYAMQRDAFENPVSIEADYFLAGIGVNKAASRLAARIESLSGSPGDGVFVTPLATLHKFNGWADVFLATPADGLVDLSVELKHKVKSTTVTLIFHDFSARQGSRHHGQEIDVVAGHPLSSGIQLGVKLAHYMADETGADVTKGWIWAQLAF